MDRSNGTRKVVRTARFSMRAAAAALFIWMALAVFAPAAFAVSPQLSGGYGHSVAVKSDGTVWAWGYNESGQLGVTGVAESPIPLKVGSLSGMTAVASGETHNVALKSDGTVWTWGGNLYGELGNGGTTPSATPAQVQGLSGIVAVAAGPNHSVALKSDGTVWSWGSNGSWQLGNGTVTDSSVPVQASGLSGVTAIATGARHTLALRADGSVWAWGNGALGDGSWIGSRVPVKIPSLSRVVDIAVGSEHSLALRSDGAVWTWGGNQNGQLGSGDDTPLNTPTKVASLGEVAAVAAGEASSAAVKKDGTLFVWGANSWGELGTGNISQSFTPVQVPGQSEVVNLTMTGRHTLAAHRDGSIWIWGENTFGQVGNGSYNYHVTPVQISGLQPALAVAGGGAHSMALDGNGAVSAWGYNATGCLGNGTEVSSFQPVPVNGLAGVKAIAAGSLFSLALEEDGTVSSWGLNNQGELGNGDTVSSSTPVKVLGLTSVSSIAAGGIHALALKGDKTLWSWGADWEGQLCNDTSPSYPYEGISAIPVPATGLTGVKGASAGNSDTLALKEDGTVWACGEHRYGTSPKSTLPAQLSGLSGVKSLSGGGYHNMVLKTDGTVWAWGNNEYGALGNGTTTDSASPVQVHGLSAVTAVAAGSSNSLALKSDGTVWSWGANFNGELGNGTTVRSLLPVQVVGLSEVAEIANGGNYALARKKDGSVWVWGSNVWGQLGVNPGWSPAAAQLNLGASQLSVSGLVRAGSATGAALSGATVALAGKWATTDSTGAFGIGGIPAGTYTLTVTKAGYAPLIIPGFAVSTSRSGLEFFLTQSPNLTVSGTIRKGSVTGPPLPGVDVSIAGRTVTTDSTGSFTISDLAPGTYTVWLYKYGYARKSIPGFLVNQDRTGVTFYLVPLAYQVSGTVRKGSATGPVLPGVKVTIAGKSATTSSTGTFSIDEVPAGTHTVYLYKYGYFSKKITGFVVNGDKSGVVFYLAPAVTYSLSGTLRAGSSSGSPLAGATVAIAGKSATTSSTGAFSLTGIPAGTYTLIISKYGYLTKTISGFVVSKNMTGLAYFLSPAPTYYVSGIVRVGSASGPPLAGATVSLAGKSTTTSSTGSFNLSGIPAGVYTLSITKAGFLPNVITGFEVSGNRTGVVTFLVATATIGTGRSKSAAAAHRHSVPGG